MDDDHANGLRRASRQRLTRRIRLAWEDPPGTNRVCFGRTVNISPTGLRLRLERPIPLRSYVYFDLEGTGFRGAASVRFLRRQGLVNELGLEFTGGLRWDPARHPVD